MKEEFKLVTCRLIVTMNDEDLRLGHLGRVGRPSGFRSERLSAIQRGLNRRGNEAIRVSPALDHHRLLLGIRPPVDHWS